MNRTPIIRFIAVLTGLALAAGLSTGVASAKIKPKDGAYYQKVGKQDGYVITDGGKIAGASANMKFRDREGKACTPDGLYTYEGVTGAFSTPKRAVAPNARNRFSFRGSISSSYPKLRSSVSGRFVNRNRAIFTIKVWQGGCKASLTLRKARFTAGG